MSQKFNAKQCEMILKLAANRINIHKSKKIELSLSHKKEVADLIEQGKEAMARLRAISIIFEDYSVETFNLVELYINTIIARMDMIAIQKSCPEEVREAVCSIIYSAPYLENDADYGEPELMKVRKMFLDKYGKHFPDECVRNQCVNPKLVHHWAGKQPPEALVDFYMDAIRNQSQAELHPLRLLSRSESSADARPSTQQAPQSSYAPEVSGKLEQDTTGNMWCISSGVQPAFIAASDLAGASQGDLVRVQLHTRNDGKSSGRVLQIVEKAGAQVSGVVMLDGLGHYWVTDASGKTPAMYVLPDGLNGAQHGDRVIAQQSLRSDGKCVGRILQVTQRAGDEETRGMLMQDASGHHWVINESNRGKPMFVAVNDLNGAAHGDKVVAKRIPRDDGNNCGRVVSVLERAQALRSLDGKLKLDGDGNWLVEDPENRQRPVYISPSDLNGAEEGDVVRVQLLPLWQPGSPQSGKVTQVLQKGPKEFQAVIAQDQKGHWWLVSPSDPANTVYVLSEDLSGAQHGDNVTATLKPPRQDGAVTGRVLRIVQRAEKATEVTCRLAIDQKGHAWVTYDVAGTPTHAFIPSDAMNGAKHGDLVLAQVSPRSDGSVVGKVLSVLEHAAQDQEMLALVEQVGNKYFLVPHRNSVAVASLAKSDVPSLEALSLHGTQQIQVASLADLAGAAQGDLVQAVVQPPRADGSRFGRVLNIVSRVVDESSKTKAASSASRGPARSEWKVPVVIDSGSGLLKAGFAGETSPRCVLSSLVGHPMYRAVMPDSTAQRTLYFGKEALAKKGVLKLTHPIEHGVVASWDDLETLWDHTFSNELRVVSHEHPVLLSEPPLNSKQNRERMQEIMFEKFHVPAFSVAMQALLSLYACGRTTGTVVEIGDGVTHVVPVFEGFTMRHAISQLRFAGRDITDHLSNLLLERGIKLDKSNQKEIVRDVKEKLGYVAPDYRAEVQKSATSPASIEKNYVLPDKTTIKVGSERFRSTEPLFAPSLLGMDVAGVQHLVFKSIMDCDIDLHKPLFASIVPSGGSTMLPGFDQRLQKELSALVHKGTTVTLSGPPHRANAAWAGGSILANLDAFQQQFITKQEYAEYGPSIVHKKAV